MHPSCLLPIAAILAFAACAPSSPPASSNGAATTSNAPWTLEAARPNTSDGIRILILHDMEGLSGQSDPTSFDFGTPLYPKGQEMLAGDINELGEPRMDDLHRGNCSRNRRSFS